MERSVQSKSECTCGTRAGKHRSSCALYTRVRSPTRKELLDLLRRCEQDMTSNSTFMFGLNPNATLQEVRDVLQRAGI